MKIDIGIKLVFLFFVILSYHILLVSYPELSSEFSSHFSDPSSFHILILSLLILLTTPIFAFMVINLEKFSLKVKIFILFALLTLIIFLFSYIPKIYTIIDKEGFSTDSFEYYLFLFALLFFIPILVLLYTYLEGKYILRWF